MTTPDSKEAPERVDASPHAKLIESFRLIRQRMAFKSKTILFLYATELDELIAAVDLVNREPSEGDEERCIAALLAAEDPTRDFTMNPIYAEERPKARVLALAAINAWRNP